MYSCASLVFDVLSHTLAGRERGGREGEKYDIVQYILCSEKVIYRRADIIDHNLIN